MASTHDFTVADIMISTCDLTVAGAMASTHDLNVASNIASTHDLTVAGNITSTHDLTVVDTTASTHDLTVADTTASTHDLTVVGTTASTIHVAYTTFDIMDPPQSQHTPHSQLPGSPASQSQPAGAECAALSADPAVQTSPPCSSASTDSAPPEAASRGEAWLGVPLDCLPLFLSLGAQAEHLPFSPLSFSRLQNVAKSTFTSLLFVASRLHSC